MKAHPAFLALSVLYLGNAALPRAALAQPRDPPAEVPPPAPATLAGPRYRDAHYDRILIAPTAETNPKGSFYATSYEIVLLQFGYAVSDFTQISITGTPPLGEEGII